MTRREGVSARHVKATKKSRASGRNARRLGRVPQNRRPKHAKSRNLPEVPMSSQLKRAVPPSTRHTGSENKEELQEHRPDGRHAYPITNNKNQVAASEHNGDTRPEGACRNHGKSAKKHHVDDSTAKVPERTTSCTSKFREASTSEQKKAGPNTSAARNYT